MNDQRTAEKDCTQLLTLDTSDFITAIYRELLEREPDKEGFNTYLRLIYQRTPKEVIIYRIATSQEFNGRFKIKNFEIYEKSNKQYINKIKIKNMPVIGWFIKLLKIPDILTYFRTIEADIYIREQNLQEKLDVLKVHFDDLLSMNNQMFLGKLDTTNEIVKENFDTTNGIVKENFDATNGIVKENFDKLPKTIEIMPRFDGVSYLLDVQRIINKGLSPTYGLESVQAELISLLNDKTDEFEAYNQIPIEHLVKYTEGKTVSAAYYSQLISNYASDMKLPGIEAAGIEPALLPHICQGKDTLIIANPTLAALVITSPVLLREIAQKLDRNLVLVVHVATYPVSAIWRGFSFVEREEGKGFFRWAQGGYGNWQIQMFNYLSRPVEAKLKWFSESFCGTGELTVSCCGKTVSVELNNYIEVNFNLILQPGGNNLDINFSGPAESPEQDERILAFRIINLSCNIDDMDIDQDYLYNRNNIQYNVSILSDDYIRRTLHQSGFYDVISTAYANHGFNRREVEKTRYKYPLEYIVVNRSERYAIEPDEIVCYNAYRLRKTDVL
jgi:hypothetical protein